MYQTAQDVALLIALMLRRTGKPRGRISEVTIKTVSRRLRLRGAFLEELRGQLEDIGIMMVPLDRGGFGLLALSALEGAPSILARDHIAAEVNDLRRGNIDREAIWRELGFEDEAETE
jgi:hypothetical protein